MYMTANLAIPAFEPAQAPAEQALDALYAGRSLTADQAEALFAELVAGRLAEPSIAALLIALRLKGETADELIGAARALRAADMDFPRPDYLFADSCGTISSLTAAARAGTARGRSISRPPSPSSRRRQGCRSPSTATVRSLRNAARRTCWRRWA
jgi:anthranilate phosphoribosyltransferase